MLMGSTTGSIKKQHKREIDIHFKFGSFMFDLGWTLREIRTKFFLFRSVHKKPQMELQILFFIKIFFLFVHFWNFLCGYCLRGLFNVHYWFWCSCFIFFNSIVFHWIPWVVFVPDWYHHLTGIYSSFLSHDFVSLNVFLSLCSLFMSIKFYYFIIISIKIYNIVRLILSQFHLLT